MTHLKRLGLVAILGAVVPAAIPLPTAAYSCAPVGEAPGSPTQFDRSIAIFSATVVEQSTREGTATLDVLHVWKGELTQRITMRILRFPPFVTTIDWLFEVGQTYLILGFGDSIATMLAEKCTLTSTLADAGETLELLKTAGYSPRLPR
jgi:hypothetical protein